MQAQYNDQSLAQAWNNLDLNDFGSKKMIEGLGKSLTTV